MQLGRLKADYLKRMRLKLERLSRVPSEAKARPHAAEGQRNDPACHSWAYVAGTGAPNKARGRFMSTEHLIYRISLRHPLHALVRQQKVWFGLEYMSVLVLGPCDMLAHKGVRYLPDF